MALYSLSLILHQILVIALGDRRIEIISSMRKLRSRESKEKKTHSWSVLLLGLPYGTSILCLLEEQ